MDYFKLTKEKDLNTYIPSDDLIAANQMSLALGRPLLLSGKPGTGKTQFAYWLSNQAGFNPEPFVFNTKSTSVFTDLFYYYDAVSHFRSKDERKASEFIELTALGKAIISAKKDKNFKGELLTVISKFVPRDANNKTVVLIDEVDKAPRDFPNDLLYEIENLSFTIKEISNEPITLTDEEKKNITVILTSNFEKSLPDAFLRRCLFYHIPFPDIENLKEIVKAKLGISDQKLGALKNKLDLFFILHGSALIQKKPGTSECIDWINWLDKKNLLDKSSEDIKATLSILLKNETDQEEGLKILSKK